jgi:anti-anti-sigma factor
VNAESLVMLAMTSIVLSVLVARLLGTRNDPVLPAVLPGNLIHPTGSDVDVLRVGSAALVTLRGELYANEARRLARRCGDMVADGVAHLVVEFKDADQLSDAALQFLLCLSELERVRHGRVCVVCPDQMVQERLESAGLFENVACLTPASAQQ